MINLLKTFKIVEENIDFEINILGSIENPLFHAKDLGTLLGFSNIRVIINEFDDDERLTLSTKTVGGNQKTEKLYLQEVLNNTNNNLNNILNF